MHRVVQGRFIIMKMTHRERFVVKFHEVDFRGKVKLFTIMDYIQHTAEVHGTSIGLGFENMMNHGLFWVVSRMKLNMERYPGACEEVIIETELAGCEKLFCVRRFTILDGKENIIGNATLYYLMVDAKTKFPQKPKVCPIDIINVDVDNKGHEGLKKLKMPGDEPLVINRALYYNEIDANNHVNNAKYVSFVEDCFSLKWHEEHEIASMQINYVKEIKAEDTLKLNIYSEEVAEKIYYINGTNEDSLLEFFQCKVNYR